MEADNSLGQLALPAPLCVITDRHRASSTLPDAVSSSVRGGARWIRVREPDLELAAYAQLCYLLIDAADNSRVTWSVRPSAYLLMRSAWPELRLGVHLASNDAPWRAPDAAVLLGRSVHVDDAAHKEAVDYQLLSPVFHTACKPDAAPTGIETLTRFAQPGSAAVIALGGVTPGNAAQCLRAGAAGVAVCGGVMESESPDKAVAAYLAQLQQPAE